MFFAALKCFIKYNINEVVNKMGDKVKNFVMESISGVNTVNTDSVLAGALNIILSMVIALVMSLVIFYIYKKAFRGVVYSRTFGITLAGMTLLTAMITLAISSNVVLSLGMVGALSIVRYRTAIKDPMDLLFLFWAVATGITIGARMYYVCVIGAVFVVLLLIIVNKNVEKRKTYILIIHYTGSELDFDIKSELGQNPYKVKAKTVRKENTEMAIEIAVKNDNLNFVEKIKEHENVQDVTLIQYMGEYNG